MLLLHHLSNRCQVYWEKLYQSRGTLGQNGRAEMKTGEANEPNYLVHGEDFAAIITGSNNEWNNLVSGYH